MKKADRYLWGFIFGMALVQGSLFAEMVQGQVTAINRENQSITVLAQDSSGAAQKSRELTLRSDAQFSGIHSLADLEVGDEIQAEVNRKLFGKEEVRQLTAKNVQISGETAEILSPTSIAKSQTAKSYAPAGSQFSPREEAMGSYREQSSY